MAPIPQATNSNNNNNNVIPGLHLPIWAYVLLALCFVTICTLVCFLVIVVKRRFTKVKDIEDTETKGPSLIHIPIPDLPLNSQYVSFEWKGVIYSYPSCQASVPPTFPQAGTIDAPKVETARQTGPEQSSSEAKPTPSAVEQEEQDDDSESVDIVDRISEYYSNSFESSYSQLSALDASFWEFSDPSLPNILIVDCDGPLPTEECAEDTDLEDILLATALSTLNITKDLLPVPPPSFNAPRPEPTLDSDSDSESEYDSEDDRDPLDILCDILDISGDDPDSSYAPEAIIPPAADKLQIQIPITAPLRISQA